MVGTKQLEALLEGLNPQQRAAVVHDRSPALIVAGAGTGKTTTLVRRVAYLIATGTAAQRILLLSFTRRAAQEMLRRVDETLARHAKASKQVAVQVTGGTFHGIAHRLLRTYGEAIGLRNSFSILDQSDAQDLMEVLRNELKLPSTSKKFPKKGTCLDIYSRTVNSRQSLGEVLQEHYPWCGDFQLGLKELFTAFVARKEQNQLLDYDDLLVFWNELLADPKIGPRVRGKFDCVLVDEYQDTNRLQADLLKRFCPSGEGLTVVGDDAQSIYSFRAATVRNILDFPKEYPETKLLPLEQNYRSSQAILDASNALMNLARDRYEKRLFTERSSGEPPRLITCVDEDEQARYLVDRILELYEDGVPLDQQAVLFRSSFHAMVLESELARRDVPYVKYGGMKFLESAHIKDALAFLRLAENWRDVVSAYRILTLLPGVGPKRAEGLLQQLLQSGGDWQVWHQVKPPKQTQEIWPEFMCLLSDLVGEDLPLEAQLAEVREFYTPILEDKYDSAATRLRDLEQLEQMAHRYDDRRTMLAELTLDPPTSVSDLPDESVPDDDYLILSTIHSAKGLEWDTVYVISASDGYIPPDTATSSDDQLEEERRLLYVALTRAKNRLIVTYPQRYYLSRRGVTDPYRFSQVSRFLTAEVQGYFSCQTSHGTEIRSMHHHFAPPTNAGEIRQRMNKLWE